MKVLVTGGAGYIGAHVVRMLDVFGHEPVVLDDLRRSYKRRVGPYPWERIPLEEPDSVFRIFHHYRPHAVIHLGGYISVSESVKNPEIYWRNNLAAGMNLLSACERFPLKKFIFSSTAAVYGKTTRVPIKENSGKRPSSPYGASKYAFEDYMHAYGKAFGFKSFALRYFNAAGAYLPWDVGEEHEPEEHLIPKVIRAFKQGEKAFVYGKDYPTPDGTCVRDFIHVRDLAFAHVELLESGLEGGQNLNAGTGRGYSVLQVIQEIASQMKVSPQIDFLPRRPCDPASLVADPSLLRSRLGWKPQHSSLQEMISTAVHWESRRDMLHETEYPPEVPAKENLT